MTAHLRTPAEVGAAIRARRRALGWDQATLAEAIGASRLWVSQIEGGKPGAGLGLVLRAFAAMDLRLSIAGQEAEAAEAPPPVESADIEAILRAARK